MLLPFIDGDVKAIPRKALLLSKNSNLPFFCWFTAINLSFPNYFGGIRLDNYRALMKADTRTSWFYPIGVIFQQYTPYFPGPDQNFQTSEMQLLVLKEC